MAAWTAYTPQQCQVNKTRTWIKSMVTHGENDVDLKRFHTRFEIRQMSLPALVMHRFSAWGCHFLDLSFWLSPLSLFRIPCVPCPMSETKWRERGTAGTLQWSLCIEELKIEVYSACQLSPGGLASHVLLLWHFDVIFLTILLLRSAG